MDSTAILIGILGLMGTIGGGMIGAYVTIRTQLPVSKANALKARIEAQEIEERIRRDLLKDSEDERKKSEQRMDALDHDFKVVMSFARTVWSGSRKLHDQVVEHQKVYHLEPPVYTPPDSFPTGPLGKLTT